MTIESIAGLKFTICAFTLAAFSVAGCASGPIDMMRSQSDQVQVLERQAGLRADAVALVEQVEASGWSLAPPPGEQARSFLGRLIGGASEPAEAGDPVIVYLESVTIPGGVAADLSGLSEKARRVALSAHAVAAAPEDLSRTALERDIAAAENALGAVRRARAFFAEASVRVSDAGDAPGAELAERLAALAAAETALAEAADALAERRWAGHGDVLSG